MNDTTTPVPNVNRLTDLARWLTEQERRRRLGQPSEWNQEVWVRAFDEGTGQRNIKVVQDGPQAIVEGWSCGTAACAAGHISLEDGGRPLFRWGGEDHPVPPPASYGYDDLFDAIADTISECSMLFGNRAESIDEHAQRVLGLDTNQATRLFDGSNDWESMMHLIAQFTGVTVEQLVTVAGGDDLPDDPDDSGW